MCNFIFYRCSDFKDLGSQNLGNFEGFRGFLELDYYISYPDINMTHMGQGKKVMVQSDVCIFEIDKQWSVLVGFYCKLGTT